MIPPLIVVGKVPRRFDKVHSYTQIAADAAPIHLLVAVLLFVGIALVGSLLPHPCKIARSDPS